MANGLKEARQNAGLSQVQLAKEMGVGVDTIGRWERAEYRVPFNKARMLVGILSAYGLTMQQLGYVV